MKTDQSSAPAPSTSGAASTATPHPEEPSSPPAREEDDLITIHDFQKVHLKIAHVVTAERIPKSAKLLKLQVDLGTERRQIVAGIGKKYSPEEMRGKTVVVVANLKPATLMGVASQGMILAAGDQDVQGLIAVETTDVQPGTTVK